MVDVSLYHFMLVLERKHDQVFVGQIFPRNSRCEAGHSRGSFVRFRFPNRQLQILPNRDRNMSVLQNEDDFGHGCLAMFLTTKPSNKTKQKKKRRKQTRRRRTL